MEASGKIRLAMNTLTALLVASAVFVVCFSEKHLESMDKFVKFYNCIACKAGSSEFLEYIECLKYKPAKCKEVSNQCKEQLIPGARNETEQWEQICKNSDIAEKFYDCIGDGEEKVEMSEDDKENMEEFKKCAIKFYEAYCPK